MKNIRGLTILFLILFSGVLRGQNFTIPNACGTFEIRGWVVIENHLPYISVFKNTESEIQLSINPSTAAQALGFDGKPVTVRARILKPIRAYSGDIAMDQIHLRNPFGRTPNEITDGFELIKKTACLTR